MKEIKRFQVRGIPSHVTRMEFEGRTVDFWAPIGGSDRVLIAHDGQNIFDPRTATHLRRTWRLTQNAIRVAQENQQTPPLVIGVFHSSSKSDPYGRLKDLSPENAFKTGVQPNNPPSGPLFSLNEIRSNSYLQQIWQEILPKLLTVTGSQYSPDKTAMIGSSMGGLATLYSFGLHSEFFRTALAFSPHWILGGDQLVDYLIQNLPNPAERKLWMSRGTKGLDAKYEPHQYRADQQVLAKGWNKNFSTKIYKRTGHNEKSWSSYVDEALRFWLDYL